MRSRYGRRLRWGGSLAALMVVLTTGVVGTAPRASADTFASSSTGSHLVQGAILAEYVALGGPSGQLGYPVTDELPTPRIFGRYNHFQYGSIYWSPATGAHLVVGAIRDRWASLGWEGSSLGFPTTDETRTPNGTGAFNRFTGGSIYWSPATGAHMVMGAIGDQWAALGSEGSSLGFPTTDETRTPNGLGAFNHFTGGSIYWSPATGAHLVVGAIRDRWASLGWEGSFLGFPTTDDTPTPNGLGAFNHFTGGSIYLSPATGAHVIMGGIRDQWVALGSETSPLGFPTSDEYASAGGRRSDCEHGSIIWTPGLGTAIDLTLSGLGFKQITLPFDGAPQVAEVHALLGGPSYATGSISVIHSNGAAQLLTESQNTGVSTDFIFPINLKSVNGSDIRGFDVKAYDKWSIHIMPASSVPTLSPGHSITSTYDTQVVHYTGPGGALAMTSGYSVSMGILPFGPDGGYRPPVVLGPDGTGTVPADTYLAVMSGAQWTLAAR